MVCFLLNDDTSGRQHYCSDLQIPDSFVQQEYRLKQTLAILPLLLTVIIIKIKFKMAHRDISFYCFFSFPLCRATFTVDRDYLPLLVNNCINIRSINSKSVCILQ